MRPRSLEEVAGQKHLLRRGSPLVALASDRTGERGGTSVILWGPPGTGKTTLAQAIAHSSGRRFVELSAVTAGVKDVRQAMEEALSTRDLYGTSTVLFLDEIHRFTKAQQDALLPGVENGWVILIAATTENPSFSVIAPLLSRSLLLTLETLSDDDLGLRHPPAAVAAPAARARDPAGGRPGPLGRRGAGRRARPRRSGGARCVRAGRAHPAALGCGPPCPHRARGLRGLGRGRSGRRA